MNKCLKYYNFQNKSYIHQSAMQLVIVLWKKKAFLNFKSNYTLFIWKLPIYFRALVIFSFKMPETLRLCIINFITKEILKWKKKKIYIFYLKAQSKKKNNVTYIRNKPQKTHLQQQKHNNNTRKTVLFLTRFDLFFYYIWWPLYFFWQLQEEKEEFQRQLNHANDARALQEQINEDQHKFFAQQQQQQQQMQNTSQVARRIFHSSIYWTLKILNETLNCMV